MFGFSNLKDLFAINKNHVKQGDSEIELKTSPAHLQTNVSAQVYLDIFDRPVHDAEAQFYPPKVNGLSVFCIDAILNRYSEHIEALQEHVDIGLHRTTKNGENLFDARYVSVIRRLASYVHMLPASEYHHHSQPGGLFRHSLDAALIALRKADNQLPPTVGKVDLDDQRRIRYLYAAWLGALLHDTGKVLTDMQVSAYTIYDESTQQSIPIACWKKPVKPWIPQIEDLIEWASRNKVERYFVHFKSSRVHKEHVASGAALLPHILKGEGLEFVMDSPDDLYGNLTAALNGYAHVNSYLATAIRFGDSVSTAKDVKSMATAAFGTVKKSRMLSIVDTIRSLKRGWKFNSEKAHAFVIGDCVFLRWQSAFNSIQKAAIKNKFDVLPNDLTSLLGMMEDFRIIEPFDTEHRSVMFAMGKFTEDDVAAIIDGTREISWIELIKVVYREWVYDSDPIHPNLEGLIYLSKTQQFYITKTDGSCTELKIDTNALKNDEDIKIESTNELKDTIKIKSAEEATENEQNAVKKQNTPIKNKSAVLPRKESEKDNKNKKGTTSKVKKPKKPLKAETPVIAFENDTTNETNNDRCRVTSPETKCTPKREQATEPESLQLRTPDYILQHNNKWYIKVEEYTVAHSVTAESAGPDLLKQKLIRKPLGTATLSVSVAISESQPISCFELTPTGKSKLINSLSTERTPLVSEEPTAQKTENSREEAEKALLPKLTNNEIITDALTGSLVDEYIKHGLTFDCLEDDPNTLVFNLRDLSIKLNQDKSVAKTIYGLRISKFMQTLMKKFNNPVSLLEGQSYSIQVNKLDATKIKVFK